MMHFSIVLLALIIAAEAAFPLAPIVKLKAGEVRGIIHESDEEVFTHFYEGIRYGRAQRFAKPTPEPSWSGVYNATSFQQACPQGYKITDKVITDGFTIHSASEDCLFLNLWTPAAPKSSKPLPVMVFFYGGGFKVGHIFQITYDSRFLSSQGDVVVVTVNYRLGAFGFLNAGIDEAPGNQGLYDQILALKWVQENVHSFGGDPNLVTIFGHSAGSMSVGALMLSPLAKGLFHRAIMESGPINSFFGSDSAEVALKKGHELAERLNCTRTDPKEMVACLGTKTPKEINDASKEAIGLWPVFIPSYETELLPIKPTEALKTGKFNHVDLMYGVTRDEGTGFFVKNGLIPQIDPTRDGHDINLENVKNIINFLFQLLKEPTHAEVADFYSHNLKNESDKVHIQDAVWRAFADYQLVCPSMFFGEAARAAAPTKHYYSYRLNQVSSFPVMSCTKEMNKVCHGMDLVFVFGILQRLRGIMFPEDEYHLSRDMIQAWSNFARDGHPGTLGLSAGITKVEWQEAISEQDPYTKHMSLSGSGYEMIPDAYREVCNGFWKAKLFV